MDLCLTGRFMDAQEAERAGLVASVVPEHVLLAEAMKAAKARRSVTAKPFDACEIYRADTQAEVFAFNL